MTGLSRMLQTCIYFRSHEDIDVNPSMLFNTAGLSSYEDIYWTPPLATSCPFRQYLICFISLYVPTLGLLVHPLVYIGMHVLVITAIMCIYSPLFVFISCMSLGINQDRLFCLNLLLSLSLGYCGSRLGLKVLFV